MHPITTHNQTPGHSSTHVVAQRGFVVLFGRIILFRVVAQIQHLAVHPRI